MSNVRPATSKARGVCKYYQTTRGCFAGANCKFLHGEGESLTPYDNNKTCRYFAAGYCLRGEKCWFRHVQPAPGESPSVVETPAAQVGGNEEEDDDLMCSICYDTPMTFGLLDGCSHVFCIGCIKGWRDPKDKDNDLICSGNTKKCPSCRAPSQFVTPSRVFYSADHPGKEETIARYKAHMSTIPCNHFQRSPPSSRFCPFGKDCFYQHLNADGTPFIFNQGVQFYMRFKRRHEQRDLNSLLQERSRPVLAHINATIDSIRASMEGNVDALTNHREWQGPELSAAFLAGLTEDRTWSLIEDIGQHAFAEQINAIWGDVLPRLEAVVEEFGLFLGDETGREEPHLSPNATTAPIEDSEPESNTSSTADVDDQPDDASDISASVVFDFGGSDGAAEPATPEMPEDETLSRQEEVEPPFLTDGRGRVVWSNTKPTTSNSSA